MEQLLGLRSCGLVGRVSSSLLWNLQEWRAHLLGDAAGAFWEHRLQPCPCEQVLLQPSLLLKAQLCSLGLGCS